MAGGSYIHTWGRIIVVSSRRAVGEKRFFFFIFFIFFFFQPQRFRVRQETLRSLLHIGGKKKKTKKKRGDIGLEVN